MTDPMNTSEPKTLRESNVSALTCKWKVSRSVDGDFLAVYPDAGRPEFPVCKKPGFMRDDVWSELARKISAVPEMLDMLQEALGFIVRFEDVNDGDDGAPEPNKAMILASEIRALLAKAGASQ